MPTKTMSSKTPSSTRVLALALLLACMAPVAIAQVAQPAIEKQTATGEFEAAGLDQLSWTIEIQAMVAADIKKPIGHGNGAFFASHVAARRSDASSQGAIR